MTTQPNHSSKPATPTVDAPPGKQGYQAQHPDFYAAANPVPDWKEGANPPGTNPPKPPKNDPATTPIPGSTPTFNQGETPEKKDQKSSSARSAPSHKNEQGGASLRTHSEAVN